MTLLASAALTPNIAFGVFFLFLIAIVLLSLPEL